MELLDRDAGLERTALTVAELDWLHRIDAAPDFFKLVDVVAEMREALGDGAPAHVTAAELTEHSPDMPWRARSFLVLLGEVERRLQQLRGAGVSAPHRLAPALSPYVTLADMAGCVGAAALDLAVDPATMDATLKQALRDARAHVLAHPKLFPVATVLERGIQDP